MLLNSSNLKTLYTGFNTAFNVGFDATETHWKKVAIEVPSGAREEEYGWLGQFPDLREWSGDRIVNSLAAHDFKIKNKTFEHTISVRREDIEDDRFNVHGPYFQEAGRMAAMHPEKLVMGLFAAGETSLAYDGQFFFDVDHPVLDENGNVTSVSNIQAGGGTPWYLIDGSKAMKPFVFQKRRNYKLVTLDRENDENVFFRNEFIYGIDARVNAGYGLWQLAYASKAPLTAANYGTARAAMMTLKGDYGRRLGITPTILLVGPADESAARQLLFGGSRIESTGAPAGDTTHVAVTNEWKDSAQIIVSPYL